MSDVEVIQVIRTYLTVRGGSPVEQARGDTCRRVEQFWSLDGRLLAENDPHKSGVGEEVGH